MTSLADRHISRRGLLAGGGALVVSFTMVPSLLRAQQGGGAEEAGIPSSFGSLADYPMLDSWIRIDEQGKITVFTGKAELGQGVKTAFIQVAAEELEVDPAAITLLTADTGQTPNEGYTAASHSMEESGTAIFNAAAQVRTILLDWASERFDVPADQLQSANGAVRAPDGRTVSYGDLVRGRSLHVRAKPQSQRKDPKDFTVIGKSLPRVDIPAKVTGGVAYVQDLRLDGMVHARVVRPPTYGAKLVSVDTDAAEEAPGVIRVIRDGSYLAIVAEREFQAIRAMNVLADGAEWSAGARLPKQDTLYETLRSVRSQRREIVSDRSGELSGRVIRATYKRPYQMHGSIGPSCAVGLFENGSLTVWSHTQGVYPDRAAIAELLGMMEDQVRLIHMEGAGCYGHNGADDAAADAALIARAMPGRPVRVQWMREQEHAWEPYGCAMVMEAAAALDDAGNITG